MTIKQALSQAINARHTIECIYHGKKRFLEPYHFGSLGGREQLHCFQYAGESESGGLPEWRNLQLDEIRELQIDNKQQFTIRASYHPGNAHYTFIEKRIDEHV